jgi:AcrR family transcriptional regulator
VKRVNQRDEQRAATRRELLAAGADLFAARGVDGCSVGDVARAAGRTTGAIYDHFATKQGLVFALVEEWAGDNATATTARLEAADDLDERLTALWLGTTDATTGDGRWLNLEHELWSYAQRDDEVLGRLRTRFRELWAGIEALADVWPDLEGLRGKGPLVMGVLTGVEMMRRVDPTAITDEMAVAVLRGAIFADRQTGAQA